MLFYLMQRATWLQGSGDALALVVELCATPPRGAVSLVGEAMWW